MRWSDLSGVNGESAYTMTTFLLVNVSHRLTDFEIAEVGSSVFNDFQLVAKHKDDSLPSMRWLVFGAMSFLLGRMVRARVETNVGSPLEKSRATKGSVQVISQTGEIELTPEFVSFAEEKVKEHFSYILDCYDVAKKEGQNVLQWLFGAAIGGVGLVGSLAKAGYWPLAFGVFVAACWAARKAAILIGCLNSQEIRPPGNSSEAFKVMRDEGSSNLAMRWRETRGLTIRAEENSTVVELVAKGVDRARNGIAYLPAWFIGGTTAAWIFERIYFATIWVVTKTYEAGCLKRILDALGL